jgi:small GTP-binding protein
MTRPTGSKVILLGDPSVGKTSILQQYNLHQFDATIDATIGANLISKLIRTPTGSVQIHIWDTAGQERYRSLMPMYTRNSAAAIIVLDVANIQSFRTLDSWLGLVRDNSGTDCQVFIAANKMDLEVVIPMQELEHWCTIHDCLFFRVCAKEFDSVDRLFQRVAEGLGEKTSYQPVRSADQPVRRRWWC